MTAIPFEERPSSKPSPPARPEWPDGWPHSGDSEERAIAELIRHEVLSDTFGNHGEYEVRTTIATHQAWQYRCCVLRRGKVIKRAFVPIIVDGTPYMQHVRPQPCGTEAMRLSFAKEAVEVHFTRCAALQEYLMLAAIYSQPPSDFRRRYPLLVLMIGAAFLTAYGFWAHALRTGSGQPSGHPLPLVQSGSPAPPVQGAPQPAIDRGPNTVPRSVPLPMVSAPISRDILDKPAGAPRTSRPAETPKAVRLTDLLSLEQSPEKANHTSRALTSRMPPASTASDVQTGDLLLLTGWIHRISRAPDSTYRLQVSPNPRAATPSLIAVVPPPDLASGSPAMRAQLQTVRAFITRQLLRQQEPSPRGSVIHHPIFVQLTGQLAGPDASLAEPSRGKGVSDATARWEVRPVVEMRLATPPAPSDHKRSK
jgi:hypothetical protein